MKVLVVGSSPREYRWWISLKELIPHNIVYVNASSRFHNLCINLYNIDIKYVDQKPCYSLLGCDVSDIYHETLLWPNKSINELYSKYLHHYKLFTQVITSETPDFILVENGAYIYVNALLKAAKNLSINLYLIEPSNKIGNVFIYCNSPGPDLEKAVVNSRENNSLNKHTSLSHLVHDKDTDVDLRVSTSFLALIYNLFKYIRRNTVAYPVSTDGSLLVAFDYLFSIYIKKFIIVLHWLKKYILLGSFSNSKVLIIPLHLEKDLHLSQRTSFTSQFQFAYYIYKLNKDCHIFFKLHPHSVRLGPSIIDHIRFLFSPFYITSLKPNELIPNFHEVHSMGSKYSLESAGLGISSFSYGNTFFSPQETWNLDTKGIRINSKLAATLSNGFYYPLSLYSSNLKYEAHNVSYILSSISDFQSYSF